jgi:hypothetical protein
MGRAWTSIVAMAVTLSACSAPLLRPLYAPESLVQDPGIIGEWATDGPTVTRVVVSEGVGGRYVGALTVHQNAELKTGLSLELSLTEIGEDRYLDLYLARSDREALAARYGFLALPVHQFMVIERDADVVRVSTFNADWIRRAAAENAFACEILPVGGLDIAVITADSGSFREFLRAHARDPGARSSPLVFRRVR